MARTTDTCDSEAVREADLVSRAHKLLVQAGILAKREVPILGRSADLVCLKGSWLWSVEFKLHDWRRALQQACDHALAADYSCVCMPRREVPQAMEEEFDAEGVGLLFLTEDADWPFEVVVRPKRSKATWSTARGWLLDYLRRA